MTHEASANRVEQAAVRCSETGTIYAVPRPGRHDDVFRLYYNMHWRRLKHNPLTDQGFLDTLGNFLTREEAKQLALASGQHFVPSGNKNDPRAYSECMW